MITYSMYSDKGTRSNNEDSVGMQNNNDGYCFVLCDGLGGHSKGEVASQTAVSQVCRYFNEAEKTETFIKDSIGQAQSAILKCQKENRELYDMKTTIVVLVTDGKSVQWGHVGDSRLYHFRKNKILRRTLDHSVPQMLVRAGEIKEKEIRMHPDRNRLLRVLGANWSHEIGEISARYECKGKEAFLLCSDGFWELITEKEMIKLLKKSKSVDEWLNAMSDVVRANGQGKNMDNYSAIGVFIE